MAKQQQPQSGSWAVAEELFQRGDPAFVDEIRRITDAERLGEFATRWFEDRRPEARRLLADYLDRPLNALRHEPLVKRLYKLFEKAGDDEMVARFMVMFDRSVRRARRKRYVYDRRSRRGDYVDALQVPPGTTMPRPQNPRPSSYYDRLRLFSIHTRNYLRRRAWRYFRKIGRNEPQRYIPGVLTALRIYTDADVSDGVSLLDNWGLVHVLYHYSPALVSRTTGWTLAEGHTLVDVQPAPMYEEMWNESPQSLVDLLRGECCRPVRVWAIRLLQRNHPEVLERLPIDVLMDWLTHRSPEMVHLATQLLSSHGAMGSVPFERWMELLDKTHPETLESMCRLVEQHLPAERVTLMQAASLAKRRQIVVAQLGFGWLRTKTPATQEECQALLLLRDAEADSLRMELVKWARGVLTFSSLFQPEWALEWLDSRHQEVRDEGRAWMQEEARIRDNVQIWKRLLESPYDDVRLPLVKDLEARVAAGDRILSEEGALDPELLRFLWATVLLNVHRGSKTKPVVIRQLRRRLEKYRAEADVLLPLLSVALRSGRGPEWRLGLVSVVQLVDQHPEMELQVRSAFPELELNPV